MSLQDRLGSQEALPLLTAAASLSLITASSITGGNYNFPLMLFGIVAYEMRSSNNPFRQFLSLTVFTAVFDLFALFTHPLSGLITLVTFLLVILKLPIFFSCLAQLRERGGDLQFGQGSFGFQGLGAGRGPQDWSFPGGFTPSQVATPAPSAPGSFPSSGGFRLGTEDEGEETGPPPPPPAAGAGRGGYQTIA
ncbi:MAG: hypothetical protein TREMPRED_003239 [Tremellales sp. Tagirdzhanova-0007]|nr:MAG: hypothetical protein TREMPRED_003239 [Tremellales sp. Tagirdzhanova-0007]